MIRWMICLLMLCLAAPVWADEAVFIAGAKFQVFVPGLLNTGIAQGGGLLASNLNIVFRCDSSNGGANMIADKTEAEWSWTNLGGGNYAFTLGDNQSIGSVIGERCDYWPEGIGDALGYIGSAHVAVTSVTLTALAFTGTNVNVNVSTYQSGQSPSDAIAAVNLDHLVGTATGIPALPAGTYLDLVMRDGTAVYDRTTDSLQAIRDRGDAAWTGTGGLTAADIWSYGNRQLTGFSTSLSLSLWNVLETDVVTTGSMGLKLKTMRR